MREKQRKEVEGSWIVDRAGTLTGPVLSVIEELNGPSGSDPSTVQNPVFGGMFRDQSARVSEKVQRHWPRDRTQLHLQAMMLQK